MCDIGSGQKMTFPTANDAYMRLSVFSLTKVENDTQMTISSKTIIYFNNCKLYTHFNLDSEYEVPKSALAGNV